MDEQKQVQRNQKLLTPKQAVDYLAAQGCPFTLSTLATWRCLKQGPCYIKMRGRVFYTKKGLNEFKGSGLEIKTIDSVEFEEVSA